VKRIKVTRQRLFGFLWMVFVLAFLAAAFTGAFYLTGYLYGLLGWQLPELSAQIINFFLGLFFTGLIISLFSRYFRHQQMNAFFPIIQALERMAKGDFSIHLEDNPQGDGILGNLITSVNKTAISLTQLEAMRQEFISNVSHEIQSPLTSIRGFAQALQNEHLSPVERQHYLEIIETESTRLSRLTDNLLKLASLESDQVKFAPKSYRLDRQIRGLILSCEPQWAAKNLTLDVALEEVTVSADEDLLSQVWLNLLHNAIKFTPRDGTIRLALCPDGAQARFTLADSGIGIAPDDQPHIFERFYKADKSRTRSREGSGLGLAIVKEIVELHKGTIDFESQLGEGTTFTVRLPVG
jgi:two-component system, OmpR family, phosphate regulon sensor histidine kinase PhoR